MREILGGVRCVKYWGVVYYITPFISPIIFMSTTVTNFYYSQYALSRARSVRLEQPFRDANSPAQRLCGTGRGASVFGSGEGAKGQRL